MDKSELNEVLSAFGSVVEDIVEKKVGQLIAPIYEQLEGVNSRLDKLENGQKEIKLTLENEIKPSIKLLAEHQEGMAEKIDGIEQDVRYLKNKVSINQSLTDYAVQEIHELKSK